MRFSIKAQTAIILASHLTQTPIKVEELKKICHISVSYGEQLLKYLRTANIAEGVRGPGGGYKLLRPADEISVLEIVVAIDGDRQDGGHMEPLYEAWERAMAGITLDKLRPQEDKPTAVRGVAS